MLRRIAHPLLASVFVVDGLRTAAHPHEEVEHLPLVEEAVEKVAAQLPSPVTPDLLLRGLGVAKVGAGLALGFSIAPRVAASILTVLHLPTLLGRHPFWTKTGRERREAIGGLVRDAAILGGLLLAVVDTDGKPSLAWRAEHAAEQARKDAGRAAKLATREAKHVAKDAKVATKHVADDVKRTTKHVARDAKRASRQATKAVLTGAERDVARLEAGAERTIRHTSRAARKAAKRVEREVRHARRNVEHAVGDVVEGTVEKVHAVIPG